MSASFLHNPVRNQATIEKMIESKHPEGEQLDFKDGSRPYKKGEEAAKDVAAFANHLGGDIRAGG